MKAPFVVAVAGALLFVAAGLLAVGASTSRDALALAPCKAHTNSSEELQFLSLVQSWRNETIAGSQPLTLSTPLNDAAAGYAQFLADHPGTSGHYADGGQPGRAWADRAIQCGYPAAIAAGGEGVAIFTGSATSNATPASALAQMTQHQWSGV